MLSPQTASPASWKPPTAGGDTTDDEAPAPRSNEPDASAPAPPPAAPDAAPPPPPPAAAPVAPEHVLLETTPPPPPPASAKWKEGDKVVARWHLGCHYPGTIHAVKANGVYAVSFDDGDYDDNVIENHIRAAPAPTPTDEPPAPAPAPAPALPPPGSRITVRFSDGIDYGGTITELLDEHHARVLYDDGQSETVRFPDPDVRVLRAAPAPRAGDDDDDAEGLRVGGGAIDNATGRACHVVEKKTAWWTVKFPGSDKTYSRRASQLTAAAAPPAEDDAPAPAPSPAAADKVDEEEEEAEAAPAPAFTPGGPIRVRTAGGREAIVLEKMQRGWFRVVLDGNANEEGGANERKTLGRLKGFAPGQDHLLDAAPQAAFVPKPKGSSSKGRKSVQQTAPQAAIVADKAPAPKMRGGLRPRWSSEEEKHLRDLVTELGETRWAAIAMRLGTGRTGAAVELRWATLKQKSPGRPPKAATAPAAAPTYDLAVGDRITMGGAPGVVVALPNPGGWWKVRRDGERTVRSARRTHIALAAPGAAPAPPGAAPAPTRKRPGAGGAAPRPAQRPRLVSRGGNDDDEAAKDARIAELEAALAQAQQAPVAPPAAAALASVTGRLRELASLRASGALTEAQFERAKNTELGLE
jgi:hypothetical protein